MEVLRQGTWLPVYRSGTDYYGNPSDGSTFDNLAAAVVCNQLGYTTLPTSVEAANAFGTPSSNISVEFYLSSSCSQVQGVPRLDQCPEYTYFDRSCYSFAAVTCSNTSGGPMAGKGAGQTGEAGGGTRHARQPARNGYQTGWAMVPRQWLGLAVGRPDPACKVMPSCKPPPL